MSVSIVVNFLTSAILADLFGVMAWGLVAILVGAIGVIAVSVRSRRAKAVPSPVNALSTNLHSTTLQIAQRAAQFGMLEINLFTQRVQSSGELRFLYRIERERDLVFIDDWLNLVHVEDRLRAAMDLDRCFRENARYRSEFRIMRRDGQLRHILAQGQVQNFGDEEQATLVGIHLDITRQRELEQAMAERVEQEQIRIGEELHDGVGQQLTGLGLLSRSLFQSLSKENSPLAPLAKDVAELVPDIVRNCRMIIRDLIPVDLDAAGLLAAFRQLAEDASTTGNVPCVLEASSAIEIEDNRAARQLFRIAQEAVNNAVKHSQAKNITIRLRSDHNSVELTVTDDGVGFTPEQQEHDGRGLHIFRHRAETLGAQIRIESSPGKGTMVRVLWRKKFDDDRTTWSQIPDTSRG